MQTINSISELGDATLPVGTLLRVLTPISMIWEVVASSDIVVGTVHLKPRVEQLEALLGRKVVVPYIGAEIGVYSNTPSGWIVDPLGRACAVLTDRLYAYTETATITIASISGSTINSDSSLLTVMAAGTDTASPTDTISYDDSKPLSPGSIEYIVHSLIKDNGVFKQTMVDVVPSGPARLRVRVPLVDITFSLKGEGTALIQYERDRDTVILNNGLDIEVDGAYIIIDDGVEITNASSPYEIPKVWVGSNGVTGGRSVPTTRDSNDAELLLKKHIDSASEDTIPSNGSLESQGYYEFGTGVAVSVVPDEVTVTSRFPAGYESYKIGDVESTPTTLPINQSNTYAGRSATVNSDDSKYINVANTTRGPSDPTLTYHTQAITSARNRIAAKVAAIDNITDFDTTNAITPPLVNDIRSRSGFHMTRNGDFFTLAVNPHSQIRAGAGVSLYSYAWDELYKPRRMYDNGVYPADTTSPYAHGVYGAVDTGITEEGDLVSAICVNTAGNDWDLSIATTLPVRFFQGASGAYQATKSSNVRGMKVKTTNDGGSAHIGIGNSPFSAKVVVYRPVPMAAPAIGYTDVAGVWASIPFDNTGGYKDFAVRWPYSATIQDSNVNIYNVDTGVNRAKEFDAAYTDLGTAIDINVHKNFAATIPSRNLLYIGDYEGNGHTLVHVPSGSTIGGTVRLLDDGSAIVSTHRSGKLYSLMMYKNGESREYILPGAGVPGDKDFAISEDTTKLIYPGATSIRVSFKILGHF